MDRQFVIRGAVCAAAARMLRAAPNYAERSPISLGELTVSVQVDVMYSFEEAEN